MTQDQKLKVCLILEILSDKMIKDLLIFVLPIIKQLETFNLIFQAENIDPLKPVKDISFLTKSFELRVKNENENFDHKTADFGMDLLKLNPDTATKIKNLDQFRILGNSVLS